MSTPDRTEAWPMRFRLGGLDVLSAVAWPEAQALRIDAAGAADVVIVDVPDVGMPTGVRFEDRFVSAGEDDFVVRPRPGLAFRLRGGREILMARRPDVPQADAWTYLTGAVWGVLCHQRGLVPLHCSAIARSGRAALFAGPSGAGKSTLAAGLWRRGHATIGDDLCVIDETAEGHVRAHIVASGLKLCGDAVQALGFPHSTAAVREDGKTLVDLTPRGAASEGLPITILYLLTTGGHPELVPLRGRARLEGVLSSVYRGEWLAFIREPGEAFARISALARKLEVVSFARPRDMARFEQGLAALEQHMHAIEDGELAA